MGEVSPKSEQGDSFRNDMGRSPTQHPAGFGLAELEVAQPVRPALDEARFRGAERIRPTCRAGRPHPLVAAGGPSARNRSVASRSACCSGPRPNLSSVRPNLLEPLPSESNNSAVSARTRASRSRNAGKTVCRADSVSTSRTLPMQNSTTAARPNRMYMVHLASESSRRFRIEGSCQYMQSSMARAHG